jgi:formylglycine-generating enzyme required for sulfatase activity
VILKAMDPSPGRRYSSAAEVSDELDRFLRNQPVLARPPGVLRQAGRRLAKHRLTLIGAAAALMIPLAVFATKTALDRIASTRAASIRALGIAALDRGQTEEAAELVVRALDIEPKNSATLDLLRRVVHDFLEDASDASDLDSVERTRSLFQLWQRLEVQDGPSQEALRSAIGLQTVAVASVPPGARVTFHATRPNGRPKASRPMYEGVTGSTAAARLFKEVVAGTYWVTATLPDGSFVERPFVVPRSPAPGKRARNLELRPKSDAVVTEGMVFVRGGSLMMGGDPDSRWFAMPAYYAVVAGFYLDPTEVTQGEFYRFLVESDRAKNESLLRRIFGNAKPPEDRLDWPVTNVNHRLATEFAAWRGCRLPTEQELEWAARGNDGRVRPEGLPSDWNVAVDARWSALHKVGSLESDRTQIEPGQYLYGLYANAGELTLYRLRPYPGNSEALYTPDAALPTWCLGHAVRSGLVPEQDPARSELLGYIRRACQMPESQNKLVGFRCARSVRPLMDQSLASSDSQPPAR